VDVSQDIQIQLGYREHRHLFKEEEQWSWAREPIFLEWLESQFGRRAYNRRYPGWRWIFRDHCHDVGTHGGGKLMFNYPQDAILFKLTWI